MKQARISCLYLPLIEILLHNLARLEAAGECRLDAAANLTTTSNANNNNNSNNKATSTTSTVTTTTAAANKSQNSRNVSTSHSTLRNHSALLSTNSSSSISNIFAPSNGGSMSSSLAHESVHLMKPQNDVFGAIGGIGKLLTIERKISN